MVLLPENSLLQRRNSNGLLIREQSHVILFAFYGRLLGLSHFLYLLPRELRVIEPGLGSELDCGIVHLESLEKWSRTVVVYVAEGGLTVAANHSVIWLLVFECWVLEGTSVVRSGQPVFFEIDGIDDVTPKCWIATLLELVLVVGHKYLLSAAYAGVHAYVLRPPVITGEWSLMSVSLSHIKLQWSQTVLYFDTSISQISLSPRFKCLECWPSLWSTHIHISFASLRIFLVSSKHIMLNAAITQQHNIIKDIEL